MRKYPVSHLSYHITYILFRFLDFFSEGHLGDALGRILYCTKDLQKHCEVLDKIVHKVMRVKLLKQRILKTGKTT